MSARGRRGENISGLPKWLSTGWLPTPVETLFKAPGTCQTRVARLSLNGWKKPHSTVISLITYYVPDISWTSGVQPQTDLQFQIPVGARCPCKFQSGPGKVGYPKGVKPYSSTFSGKSSPSGGPSFYLGKRNLHEMLIHISEISHALWSRGWQTMAHGLTWGCCLFYCHTALLIHSFTCCQHGLPRWR